MKARVFPALIGALLSRDEQPALPAVRVRPVTAKGWSEKLEDATVTLAVPGGCETFPVHSTTGGRLVLEGRPLGKFGPGDEVSFYHAGEAFTFVVHRVSAERLTLWPR